MSGGDNVDPGYTEQLERLIRDGNLQEGTPAFGIARQMIEKGSDSLTEKQLKVFHGHILPLIAANENDQAMQRAIDRDPF